MGKHGDGFSIAQSQRHAGKDLAERLVAAVTADAISSTARTADPLTAGNGIAAVAPCSHGPIEIAGFRHFLCDEDTLPLQKQFKVDGHDPLCCPASVARLRTLMSRLALRMRNERKHSWPPHGVPGLAAWENPNLPAGYTYLLQLIAHDLVQTSFPLSILEDTTTGVRNDRAYRLKLDTIYAGGPQVCPFPYSISKDGKTRYMLRLGHGNQNDLQYAMTPQDRDIVRLDCEQRQPKETPQLTEVLIADPRNDDHAVLAQLTALFHHLHNGLIDILPDPQQMATAGSRTAAAFNSFLCARGAVTLMYRNVIRHDLMCRVLHGDIYQHYAAAEPRFLCANSVQPHDIRADGPPRQMLVPLEFTHAAFRFGHAMVRDNYRFNDEPKGFNIDESLQQNSLYLPGRMPLNRQWMVSWSRFFKLPHNLNRPQYSHRIGPHFSGGLNQSDLFPPIDETERTGIAYRDLLSAAFVRLWSTNSLIEEVRRRQPKFIAKSRLLDDRPYRVECLRAWLEQYPGANCKDRLTEEDIKTLADEPPLPFFIQFEAAFENENPAKHGWRLGVLGSIIVAEVIFGALVGDPVPAEAVSQGLEEAMARLSERTRAARYLAAVPEIRTMGELIEFTAEVAKLQNANPAFL